MKNSLKAKGPDYVPFWKIAAWGTRPISLGAVTIITMYFSLYCTDTLGMPAKLVGTLLLASKIFDGATDLLAGWLVDNTNTKLGKARPYELSIIGVWICMFALFAGSESWGMTMKSVWIFIMYTLVFSIFSTLLNAAETKYAIRAFKTQPAVTKVVAYSGIIVTLGSMIVSISFPALIGTLGVNAAGWRKLMAFYAIPLTVIGLIRFFAVKEVSDEDGDTKEEKVSMKDILHVIKTNKYVWLVAIAFMVPQIVTSLAAGPYYFTWIVGDITVMSTMQVLALVSLLLILFIPTLMKKYSAMQIVGATALVAFAGYVICYFAGTNLILIAAGLLLSGLITLPTSYMKSPVVMELADYNRYHEQPGMEATMAAVINFLNKIGSALGSYLLGIMLSLGMYDGTLTAQPESALHMIRLLFSLIPGVFMLIVFICSVAYRPLDKYLRSKKAEE